MRTLNLKKWVLLSLIGVSFSVNVFAGNTIGIFSELDKHFVTIPAGLLPPLQEGGERIPVASFEASRYPVTRAVWLEVMGAMPELIDDSDPEYNAELKATWNECPDCPVTYVSWERDGSPAEIQEFLAKLNKRLSQSGCTYDIPTDNQLHYMIRGDVTGTNTDKYSAGVTDTNVDQYVTHEGNSDGRIQPVGNKTLNAFGIELGNVWKISKTIYEDFERGHAGRGGSWHNEVDFASSAKRYALTVKDDHEGFSLVRTCH